MRIVAVTHFANEQRGAVFVPFGRVHNTFCKRFALQEASHCTADRHGSVRMGCSVRLGALQAQGRHSHMTLRGADVYTCIVQRRMRACCSDGHTFNVSTVPCKHKVDTATWPREEQMWACICAERDEDVHVAVMGTLLMCQHTCQIKGYNDWVCAVYERTFKGLSLQSAKPPMHSSLAVMMSWLYCGYDVRRSQVTTATT